MRDEPLSVAELDAAVDALVRALLTTHRVNAEEWPHQAIGGYLSAAHTFLLRLALFHDGEDRDALADIADTLVRLEIVPALPDHARPAPWAALDGFRGRGRSSTAA